MNSMRRSVSVPRRMGRLRTAVYAVAACFTLFVVYHSPAIADSPHSESVKLDGCSLTAANVGLLERKTTDGNRKTRSYLIEFPDNYDTKRPYGMVFFMHGAGGSAKDKSGGLRETGDAAASAIFVYPQGIASTDGVIGWDDLSSGRDMPFFDNMLSDLSADYCIDTARVFVAGFSWGGDFVTALSCARGDKIRAVVAMSTTDEYSDHANFKSYQNYPCPGAKHPAVLFIHAVDGDGAYPPPLFKTTSNLFKYMNSCGTKSNVEPTASKIMACVAYDSCMSDYTECFVDHSIGHNPAPHWTEKAWNFLSKY